MSLKLEHGTIPSGIEIKTGLFDDVLLGDYQISMEDFLIAAWYVLTNTDLTEEKDPRLQFVECIKAMNVVEGYNTGGQRLKSNIPPIIR